MNFRIYSFIRNTQPPSRCTPAQEEVIKQVKLLESKLNNAVLKRDVGLEREKINEEIMKLRKKLDNTTKSYNSKKRNADYQKTFRAKRQALIEDIISKEPSMKKKLKIRESSGRPRLKYDQPELLQALTEIA